MNVFFLLLISFIWGWVTAYFANRRGREKITWFIAGFLFTFLALIVLYFLPDLSEKEDPLEGEEDVHVSDHTSFDQHLWYYLSNARQTNGPLTFDELRQRWTQEQLQPTTYIWNETMDGWKRAEDVKQFLVKVKEKEEKTDDM